MVGVWLGLSYYPMGKSLRIDDPKMGLRAESLEPPDEYALISIDILDAWSMIIY